MSSQYSALVDKIRSKYPHQYDDLSDDELGKRWIAKYPQYQDLVKPLEPANLPKVQTTREADKSRFEEATGGQKPLATPVLPFGAAFTSAPRMIAGVLGGMGGAETGTQIGKLLNLSPEHTRVLSDVLGFVGSALTTHGAKEAEPLAKGVKITAPEGIKLPFGFSIKRPPAPEPPPPPEELAYQKTKTITEAQEAAQAEDVKRSAAKEREARQAARTREKGFEKEAQDRMAIQRRADEATRARVDAEKAAKNARLKGEEAHAKELKDIEAARQKDLAAAEKLKDQHAQSLMRRGREQAALDKAAKDAADAEDSALGELKKAPPEKPPSQGGSGVRPTAGEAHLTSLIKKDVLSPDEFAQVKQALGKDAVPKAGESYRAWQARVLGLIRAGRASRGMADVSTGPTRTPPPWQANPPEVAYRARPVGEQGIPAPEPGRPQATMSREQAEQYAKALSKPNPITGQAGRPYEVATIDLSKTPHTKVPHQSGTTWTQFESAHPESVVTEKSAPIKAEEEEFQF